MNRARFKMCLNSKYEKEIGWLFLDDFELAKKGE
jgi:hypothetical protein